MATSFCQVEPEAMFVQKAGAWHFVQGMRRGGGGGGGGLVGGHNLTLSDLNLTLGSPHWAVIFVLPPPPPTHTL